MEHLRLISGPPGCGKTAHVRSNATAEKGRYLFALPTIDLIREQAAATRLSAPLLNTMELHGQCGHRRGSVVDQLAKLPEEIGTNEHAIVYATHEAMMAANLSGFDGWRLRIDEVPQAVTSGGVNTSESLAYFRSHYSLKPLLGNYPPLRWRWD